nr:phytochelatin synthase family protein [Parashewanella curva]
MSKKYVPNVKMIFGSNIPNLKQFKRIIIDGLSHGFVIINYGRKDVKQVGSGHFLPIAAYNPKSDRFLI